jgi:uncharacterized protein YbaP (TraB family)
MRKPFLAFFLLLLFLVSQAQTTRLKNRKYQSLLWEITGNGLTRPSYLFGTMHVSSKMAFNLSDSFYSAIKSADMVALETNPESWQEDMFNFNFENDFTNASYPWAQGLHHAPEDYFTINSLKFSKYEKLIEAALASNPSAINNLLYRTYSEKETDFEEDTYLDLYIYQAGKKWGKKVFGVEDYAESMKLAMEAYMDAMKDKNKKEKSYETEDDFSYAKLQEAYRTGNLDLLDTINRLNSFSPAFDEKFLYRRNEIQAASIDSILKTKSSLFVGVGAAHLPGQRGVIEILRAQGYRLRPIKMGERNSRFKDEIEKVKVPVTFSKQISEDGFYTVDAPGKLYRYNNSFNGFDQQQYADMANGSYYIVTRIQTNASAWGHSSNDVFRKIDSLLYENIPGKILSKKIITKNGYKGFDIVNRTRRGDYQRYNIFITPFEVLFFKVSGNADYVQTTTGAGKFFNSITLKEYAPQWKKVSPAFGGFEVEMPHEPYVIRNKNWQFLAIDKTNNTEFEIIRTDVHNYNFVEEDSFDLSLMEESYTASDFFEKSLSRKQTTYKGYPALDAKYSYKDGSVALVRYLIQGPHYYTITTHAKAEHPGMMQFLNSFNPIAFKYQEPKEQTDTDLFFTVTTPYYPAKKKSFEMPAGFENIYTGITGEQEATERAVYRDKLIANDSTGEKIYISFYKSPRYEELKDSIDIKEEVMGNNKDWIVKNIKTPELKGMKIWQSVLTDSNSSRAIWIKTFYRDGVVFTIKTETDSLSQPSSFLSHFFTSFLPSDTIKGTDPSKKLSGIFFEDVFSADTTVRKRAIAGVNTASFDSTDLLQLKKAIGSLNWQDKNYLNAKKDFIDQLGTIPSQQTSLYLKDIFYAAGDTVDLQYKALENLLSQQTKYSFGVVRDILLNDPPILNLNSSPGNDENFDEETFFEGLYDSLALTSFIVKDLLPLMNIDDYKYPMIQLLAKLVENKMVSYKDYELYGSKFLIEAKQALKKQMIIEKNRAIEKAQKSSNARGFNNNEETFLNVNNSRNYGNETLSQYAVLLMPVREKDSAVFKLLNQLLMSNDKQLKYKTMLLFIRNEKQVPDSIINSFAADDNYRYDLYKDLNKLYKPNLFPSRYKNHLDLATSKLFNSSEYNKPDSIVFLAKKPLHWVNKDGLIYFFKFKRKKDDDWKIASVGLVQKDSTLFEFKNPKGRAYNYELDFTEFSNERLKDDEPIDDQLEQRLKKLVYAKRPGAKEFYKSDVEEDSDFRGFAK